MKKRVSSVIKSVEKYVGFVQSKDSDSSRNSSDDFDNVTSREQPISFEASIVWERTATGYRIADLRSDRTNTALELINSHFLQEEPMSLATALVKDETSLKNYRQFLTKIVKEGNSLCALREGTGKLVGVAVGSICLKTYQNDLISDGEALSLLVTMKNHIFAETEVESKLDAVEKYFKVDALCVDPEHRGKGVGTALLRSCVEKAKSLNLSTCVGTFSSDTSQRIEAGRLGFEKLAEIPYATYIAENQKDNPFADTGSGNYSLACMALRIIPETKTSSPPNNSPTSTNVSKKSKKR